MELSREEALFEAKMLALQGQDGAVAAGSQDEFFTTPCRVLSYADSAIKLIKFHFASKDRKFD